MQATQSTGGWTVPSALANRPYLCIINQALLSLPSYLWYFIVSLWAVAWQYPIVSAHDVLLIENQQVTLKRHLSSLQLSAVAIIAVGLGTRQWNSLVDRKLQKTSSLCDVEGLATLGARNANL
jgi:hypothetical protein